MSRPRLIADIGGTNARFALLHGSEIGQVQGLLVDDYETPADAIAAYLGALPQAERPVEAAFGAAGPVTGDGDTEGRGRGSSSRRAANRTASTTATDPTNAGTTGSVPAGPRPVTVEA